MLQFIDDGKSNRSIAAELNISEHTVKVHMWRLYNRLGVNSRTEAAKWWRDNQPGGNVSNALRAFFDGVCALTDSGGVIHPQIQYLRQRVEAAQRGQA